MTWHGFLIWGNFVNINLLACTNFVDIRILVWGQFVNIGFAAWCHFVDIGILAWGHFVNMRLKSR